MHPKTKMYYVFMVYRVTKLYSKVVPIINKFHLKYLENSSSFSKKHFGTTTHLNLIAPHKNENINFERLLVLSRFAITNVL